MAVASIRFRLYLTLLVASCALLAVWYTNAHFQERILADVALREELDGLHASLVSLRQVEKEFLSNHGAAARGDFEQGYRRFRQQQQALTPAIARAGIDGSALEELTGRIASYRTAFLAVYAKQTEIGLSYDEGEYAVLRGSAGEVEAVVRDDPLLLAGLLRLRGFEKDFMLSRDPAWSTRFATAISDFRGLLFMSELDNAKKGELQAALHNYYEHFQIAVQREIEIGLTPSLGLVGDMHELIVQAEEHFQAARADIERKLEHNIQRSRIASSGIILAAVVVVVMVLLYTSRGILRSLARAQREAAILGAGNWERPVDTSDPTEVGQVLAALERMRGELLQTMARVAADNALRRQLGELAEVLQGVKERDELAADVIGHLSTTLSCQVGAFYVMSEGVLLLEAGYGLSRDELQTEIAPGESLLGQAAVNAVPSLVKTLPEDYLRVNSGTGSCRPGSVLFMPLTWNGVLYGIVELGALVELGDDLLEFAARAGEMVAVALHAATSREETARLLQQARDQARELERQQQETRQAHEALERRTGELERSEATLQAQQEELQAQQEELRVTNEELEAQSRLLHERSRELERRNREMEQMLSRRTAS